jgi:hypothetical protein
VFAASARILKRPKRPTACRCLHQPLDQPIQLPELRHCGLEAKPDDRRGKKILSVKPTLCADKRLPDLWSSLERGSNWEAAQ